jgi:hypothetical protein
MLEKPETTMRNKESRDIGRIGEIKKEKQIKTKNKKKQTNKQANKQTKQKTKQNKGAISIRISKNRHSGVSKHIRYPPIINDTGLNIIILHYFNPIYK